MLVSYLLRANHVFLCAASTWNWAVFRSVTGRTSTCRAERLHVVVQREWPLGELAGFRDPSARRCKLLHVDSGDSPLRVKRSPSPRGTWGKHRVAKPGFAGRADSAGSPENREFDAVGIPGGNALLPLGVPRSDGYGMFFINNLQKSR
jgi:hypothetical protein